VLGQEAAMDTLSTTAAPPAPYTPLRDGELQRALEDLPGWHGDTRRISRTVRPDDLWSLLERVAAAEAEMHHHTVVDLDAGTVTFTLWTHVRDAVTDADLALARRLNDVLDPAG
jgi:4a-hydroxytetrahydrobiopterin dehydratase